MFPVVELQYLRFSIIFLQAINFVIFNIKNQKMRPTKRMRSEEQRDRIGRDVISFSLDGAAALSNPDASNDGPTLLEFILEQQLAPINTLPVALGSRRRQHQDSALPSNNYNIVSDNSLPSPCWCDNSSKATADTPSFDLSLFLSETLSARETPPILYGGDQGDNTTDQGGVEQVLTALSAAVGLVEEEFCDFSFDLPPSSSSSL